MSEIRTGDHGARYGAAAAFPRVRPAHPGGRLPAEGGDFVSLGTDHAAVGLGARTEPAALAELARLLGPEVELVPVRFEPRFLHLDMIFNLVAERLALACVDALPPEFLARLRRD